MTSSADSLVKLIVSLLLLKYITSSLINLTSDVFGGNTDGIIAAFGDINSDKLTDLFILSNKGKLFCKALSYQQLFQMYWLIVLRKRPEDFSCK